MNPRGAAAAVALAAALMLCGPGQATPGVSAFLEGQEWGDPCGGHQPGDSWFDPSGGWWTCVQYMWTDGWAYYGIRRAEQIG